MKFENSSSPEDKPSFTYPSGYALEEIMNYPGVNETILLGRRFKENEDTISSVTVPLDETFLHTNINDYLKIDQEMKAVITLAGSAVIAVVQGEDWVKGRKVNYLSLMAPLDSDERGRMIAVLREGQPVPIGRNNIQEIADYDMDVGAISGSHCTITLEGDTLIVSDENSLNGTSVITKASESSNDAVIAEFDGYKGFAPSSETARDLIERQFVSNIAGIVRSNIIDTPPALGFDFIAKDKETSAGLEYHISNDDENLLDRFLYPDLYPGYLYSTLNKPKEPGQEKWGSTEDQKIAQEGIKRLIEVECDGIVDLPDGSVDDLRIRAVNSLTKDEHYKFRLHGRGLLYQGKRRVKEDALTSKGNFLRFGKIHYEGDSFERPLGAGVRFYVTPKMPYVGLVAAKVIEDVRASDYEPYGKIWDESSNNNSRSQRTDRLLFYTETDLQLQQVLDSLERIEQENPEYFEDEPPLLAMKTHVRGVGLGEDPPLHLETSYTLLRVKVLEEAWQELIKIRSISMSDISERHHWEEIDKELLEFRKEMEDDPDLKVEVLSQFRQLVKDIAPKHGVSDINFAWNLDNDIY